MRLAWTATRSSRASKWSTRWCASRAVKNYVILNRYPYTSGHVMIVPYAHTADFSGLDYLRQYVRAEFWRDTDSAIDDFTQFRISLQLNNHRGRWLFRLSPLMNHHR